MLEKTLILLKPDAVQRGLIGEIITRFEKAGLKIIGMKMVFANKDFASKHYSSIKERVGQKIFDNTVKYITEGPVVAMCIEGINAVEIIRKMVGGTEPRSAQPGTIRGDYSHVSYAHSDAKNVAVKNLIHASGNKEDAEKEIVLWFKKDELHTYKTVHEIHTL